MLELIARGGMRIGEVLNLTPADIQERSLVSQLELETPLY